MKERRILMAVLLVLIMCVHVACGDTAATTENIPQQEETITESSEPEQKGGDAISSENRSEYAEESSQINVVGYRFSLTEDDYAEIGIVLKNMTDETLYSPRVTVGLLDENNNIINSLYMFANVALLPDQCITLYEYTESEGISSVFVDPEGLVEFGEDVYSVVVGGHLDPIDFQEGSEDFEEIEKSEINCIDGSVDLGSDGKEIGLTVEEMYFEEEDDSAILHATIKNNTEQTINDVRAEASLLDKNGNIIRCIAMFNSISVSPGQSITLTEFDNDDNLAYFSISYLSYTVSDEYYGGFLSTIPQAAER